MGMFDYIVCKMPLPGPAAPVDTEFQTKDTDAQYMETYRIEADGRLIHEARDYEWNPDTREDGTVEYAGALKSLNRRDEAVPYHGDICFYGSNHMTGERWEYTARFTEGTCVRIMLDEHNPPTTEVVSYRSAPYREGETDYEAWKSTMLREIKALGIPVIGNDTKLGCYARQRTNADGSRSITVRATDIVSVA